MLESFGNSEISPAEHIRPSKEVYFSYELKPGEPPVMTPPPPVEPFVIFGIRPCDVSAICALDHFFLERNPRDDLYARRRRAATLIALACTEPAAETCFCPCCEGGGPVAEEGFDVQLTRVGDWYIVEIASEKGERIRNLWKSLLEPATEEMLQQRSEQEEQCIEQMFSKNANIGAAVRRVSAGKVEPETWNEIAEHCYSCGACSFICPVCTCFDVNDVDMGDKQGMRVRQVDSCRTFGYPREAAGGVRGFPTACRARMYANHKLSYDHYRERGRYGCVGCGRLLNPDWDVCPYCGLYREQDSLEAPLEEASPSGQPGARRAPVDEFEFLQVDTDEFLADDRSSGGHGVADGDGDPHIADRRG